MLDRPQAFILPAVPPGQVEKGSTGSGPAEDTRVYRCRPRSEARMIKVNKSDRKELLSLLQQAVTLQVQLYDQLSAIEELTGHVTGLDAWVLREAGDWNEPEHVNLTDEALSHMLRVVKREK